MAVRPLLESAEGARRPGDRLRDRGRAVAAQAPRRCDRGDRPAAPPGDRARGRQLVPGGVEGRWRSRSATVDWRGQHVAALLERVEGEVEAVLERRCEVVADLGDVPRDDFGEVGELIRQLAQPAVPSAVTVDLASCPPTCESRLRGLYGQSRPTASARAARGGARHGSARRVRLRGRRALRRRQRRRL